MTYITDKAGLMISFSHSSHDMNFRISGLRNNRIETLIAIQSFGTEMVKRIDGINYLTLTCKG